MHPKHPTFVQNIKTVSQNGTATDHNAVSFPAGVDSFTAALKRERFPPYAGNIKTVSESGISADHNVISFPANQIDNHRPLH
jgi:hypothetical protein